ncbi:MAG: ParA family protein [Calditrichaeota bacterium]|nr:MAG: ParA family protein [Calditrichota bacterium]
MIKITVTNAKGGVAKTTTAINISCYLASQGKSVLILDIDPQANITKNFLDLRMGSKTEGLTMYDVFHKYVVESKKNIVKQVIRKTKNSDNISILPATLKMEQFKDSIFLHSKERSKVLGKILKPIQNDFDYLIIDCPADLSVYVENSIDVADYIILPSIFDFYSIDGLSLAIPLIWDIKGEEFENFIVLYTMFNPRATKIQAELEEYSNQLESIDKIFETRIPIDQNIRNSQANFINLMSDPTYKKSKAKIAYEKFGNHILTNWK